VKEGCGCTIIIIIIIIIYLFYVRTLTKLVVVYFLISSVLSKLGRAKAIVVTAVGELM